MTLNMTLNNHTHPSSPIQCPTGPYQTMTVTGLGSGYQGLGWGLWGGNVGGVEALVITGRYQEQPTRWLSSGHDDVSDVTMGTRLSCRILGPTTRVSCRCLCGDPGQSCQSVTCDFHGINHHVWSGRPTCKPFIRPVKCNELTWTGARISMNRTWLTLTCWSTGSKDTVYRQQSNPAQNNIW